MTIKGYQNLNNYCNEYNYSVKGIIKIAKTYNVAIIKIGGEKYINTIEINKALEQYVIDYENSIKEKMEKAKKAAKLYADWKANNTAS